MKYFPLHVHSHFSLLDGLSQPEHIRKRIEELELPGCALTDHGNIAGAVDMLNESKGGKLFKPALGCELYICDQHASIQEQDNRKLSHLPVIAKNDAGWKQLIQLVSASNDQAHFYHKPRLSLTQLTDYLDGSIMGFSGHMGSHLANALWAEEKENPNWRTDGPNTAKWLQDAFGKGNFYIEVQQMMGTREQKILGNMLREVSKITGIPIVATPDAHYSTKAQASDQRVLLCNALHTTMAEANNPNFGMSGFFSCDNFHIPSPEEMLKWGHTEKELENTLLFADDICSYDNILKNPALPAFPCPDGYNEETYLRQLCRDGWQRLIANKVPKEEHGKYVAQIEKELKVFEEAGLSPYFLICQDIINYIRRNGWLPGPGRGSAAGCLVSYLVGITYINPMPYSLLFERFYNAGRNTAERVSMPDIDMDVPVAHRDTIIEYIKDKYGHDKVAQMVTFQTMAARASLKGVLRAHGVVSADEMNRMTKHIPEEHKVAGELQEMKREEGASSLIKYALEHRASKFDEWCVIQDDGSLTGPLAPYFAQAIRLEGTKCAQGRHPAGVVISPDVLSTVCPMVLDPKTKKPVAGMEMGALESIGGLKLDILGLNFLDKNMGVQQILEFDDIQI